MTGAAAAPPRQAGGGVDLVQLFFNGAGRIGRTTFLWTFAAVVLGWRLYQDLPGDGAHLVLDWPVGIVTLAAASSVMSKRLHDLALAGWWSAVVTALYLFAVAGEAPTSPLQVAALFVAMLLAGVLVASPGERRFNRFGPAPGAELDHSASRPAVSSP